MMGLFAWVVMVDWPGGSWQNTVKVVLAGLITYLLVLWVLMVWWTFRDIRERTRDPFLQAAAVFVVLIFSLPGVWIYLIGRPKESLSEAYARTLEEEALLQELEDLKACPTCRRRVSEDFVICPICETQLKEPCSGCSRPLSYSWAACPYCGRQRRQLPAASRPPGPRAVESRPTEQRAPEPLEPTAKLRRPVTQNGQTIAPSPAFTARTESEAVDPA
jgi:RNA polymerase subunit RPABC4/transcription elongation factor Spt4